MFETDYGLRKGLFTGKNTRFPSWDFLINSHSQNPIWDITWEKHKNSIMKIYVWQLIEFERPNLKSLLGFYHQKKKPISKIGNYWESKINYQSKIPVLGTKVENLGVQW